MKIKKKKGKRKEQKIEQKYNPFILSILYLVLTAYGIIGTEDKNNETLEYHLKILKQNI